MALNNPPKRTLTTAVDTTRSPEAAESVSGEEGEELQGEELEKLEKEAKEMAKKILEYRATLPEQFKTTLTSILSSQRPVLPDSDSGSVPEPAKESDAGIGEEGSSSKSSTLTVGDRCKAEKVELLKDKIFSNVSAMPIVIKRVKECISKIDTIDSYSGIIHPAFKKKETS